MTERPIVQEPVGGWREPWPRVFEIAGALPSDRWALVGGLMVQAHGLAAGIETNRVTLDVDGDLRGSDRKRLAHLQRAFDERPLIAAQAPTDTLRLAQRTIEELRSALL